MVPIRFPLAGVVAARRIETMPIVMNMQWDGVTVEQYEQVRKLVGWETDVPAGGRFHVASFAAGGLRVTDIWDSAAQFNQFVETRLMPAVQKTGIASAPRVEITSAHALHVPAPLQGF
jgi:hypothetical protein